MSYGAVLSRNCDAVSKIHQLYRNTIIRVASIICGDIRFVNVIMHAPQLLLCYNVHCMSNAIVEYHTVYRENIAPT